MPREGEHIAWATHDRDFWTSINLDNTPFADWALTGMFYESVHWVEAFLASKKHHSDTHGQRASAMHLYSSELGAIQVDYEMLKQDSETARYKCYKHNGEEVRQLIPLVDNIKGYISRLL